MDTKQIDCKHESFETHSKIGRLSEIEGGPITGFVFECKVKCIQCGIFFEFCGLPNGSSPTKPMVNVDFTELRAPIRPNTGAFASSLSYHVRTEKTNPENIN